MHLAFQSLLAQSSLLDNYHRATLEGKLVIGILMVFSMFAWSVMASKALQMRRARRLNALFREEYRRQKSVIEIHERRVKVEGCPLFVVYEDGCLELAQHLRRGPAPTSPVDLSLKAMELVKGALERSVAREALRLEAGLILLAIAVSGAPFLGLLGTVWGVMDAFGGVAAGNMGSATLQMMAPGVAGALITTVAGLMVAIPSMFGYNWLVHTLRVLTVEMDNFAQELAARMEVEFLEDSRASDRATA
ncbi:MAG: MotA/TolQ/ExbB proton channel family protein [Verrucomicrobiales bacterium]|nr:MotA/TolQ/ExbB proton channel family protein [Verrucomicrobiales bacterium]